MCAVRTQESTVCGNADRYALVDNSARRRALSSCARRLARGSIRAVIPAKRKRLSLSLSLSEARFGRRRGSNRSTTRLQFYQCVSQQQHYGDGIGTRIIRRSTPNDAITKRTTRYAMPALFSEPPVPPTSLPPPSPLPHPPSARRASHVSTLSKPTEQRVLALFNDVEQRLAETHSFTLFLV